MENSDRIQFLFQKYLAHENTTAELDELLVHFSEMDELSFKALVAFNAGLDIDVERAELLRPAIAVLDQRIRTELDKRRAELDVRHSEWNKRDEGYAKIADRSRSFRRYAAAAVATLIVSAGILFYWNNGAVNHDVIAYQNDVAPGKNGATLTLANGQKIHINDALAGNIASQSGVKISKSTDGQIVYEVTDQRSDQTEYNTLTTTRGEQAQVRLPDGSLVFLNASSSLKYPTSFAKAAKRSVLLTGEGYFEVSSKYVSSSKYKVISSKTGSKVGKVPFIVETIGADGRPGQEVEVLGTHFNINAYADESSVKTTLLEGSVRVWQLNSPASQLTTRNPQLKENSQLLSPGQQSVMDGKGVAIKQVDVAEATDWKDGKFIFEEASITSIMRRVSRWYNVEVVYRGAVTEETFSGNISRSDNVSSLLSLLEKTKEVRFEVSGRTITVIKN